MENNKVKKGHLESCSLASDLLLFQKGSWCTSEIYQQLPSRVGIAQCPFQAGLKVTKFFCRCSANSVYKNHWFWYVLSNFNCFEIESGEKVWEIQKSKLKRSCFCWKEAKVCSRKRWRMLNTREVILRGDFWVFSVLFWTGIFSCHILDTKFVPKPPFFFTEGIHIVVLGIQWLQSRFEAHVIFTYSWTGFW